MTQGGLAYPTLFNVAVDSVVRHWLSITVEDDSGIHSRLGFVVGRCMGIFYADNFMIISRDPEWLQGGINVLMGLFQKVALMTNI